MRSIEKFWIILNVFSGISLALLFAMQGSTKFSYLLAGIGFTFACFSLFPLKLRAEINMSLSGISIAVLLFEGFAYFVMPRPCFTDFGFTTNARYIPDSVSGFRIQGQNIRFARILQNQIAYDNAFYLLNTNPQGFPSRHNFDNLSTKSLTRMLWMGDSFSAGLYLKTNIADQLEHCLKSDEPNCEILNFSIDGGGIKNWYQMYVNGGIAKIPHDKLVLAVYADNLNRNFAIARTTVSTIEFGRSSLPQGEWNSWLEAQSHVYKPILHRLSADQADSVMHRVSENPVCFGYHKGLQLERWWLKWVQYKAPEEMIQIQPDARLLLMKIADVCKENNRTLTLLSIPDLFVYQRFGSENPHHSMLNSISKELNCRYINGYAALDAFPSHLVPDLYLKGDRHWNQLGNDWMAAWLCNMGYFQQQSKNWEAN